MRLAWGDAADVRPAGEFTPKVALTGDAPLAEFEPVSAELGLPPAGELVVDPDGLAVAPWAPVPLVAGAGGAAAGAELGPPDEVGPAAGFVAVGVEDGAAVRVDAAGVEDGAAGWPAAVGWLAAVVTAGFDPFAGVETEITVGEAKGWASGGVMIGPETWEDDPPPPDPRPPPPPGLPEDVGPPSVMTRPGI